LITLLNDGTLIAIGYDNVVPRQDPEMWNLPALFAVSSVLSIVALVSSLIFLHILLNSWHGSNHGLSLGQVTTSIYLKVSISDFLTLFSARTGEDYFWSSRPAPVLLGAGAFALTISTILAISWPSSYPDGVYSLGLGYREPKAMVVYVWLYCLAWWLIQDVAKVWFYYEMKRHNWFGWNNTGKMVKPIVKDSSIVSGESCKDIESNTNEVINPCHSGDSLLPHTGN
jgi:H+-transporting ATPase